MWSSYLNKRWIYRSVKFPRELRVWQPGDLSLQPGIHPLGQLHQVPSLSPTVPHYPYSLCAGCVTARGSGPAQRPGAGSSRAGTRPCSRTPPSPSSMAARCGAPWPPTPASPATVSPSHWAVRTVRLTKLCEDTRNHRCQWSVRWSQCTVRSK